jgi:hypothetical protein
MDDDRKKPRLGTVQETLLIPLYARAVENRKEHALLRGTHGPKRSSPRSTTTSDASTNSRASPVRYCAPVSSTDG